MSASEPPTVDDLLPHHREHLRSSGLTDATIAAAQIVSLVDANEAGRWLGWPGSGPVPAISFLNFDRHGEPTHVLLRPDVPVVRKDGSAPKYESPLNKPPRLYFTPEPLVPRCAWTDVTIALLLIEGIKKALAAAQAGAVAISAQGTTVWHDIAYREETNRWRLHPDFEGIPLKARTVFIAFDGGDTTDNPPVILAEARLARMLLDAGAIVRLLRIPSPDSSTKVGLDDFLVGK